MGKTFELQLFSVGLDHVLNGLNLGNGLPQGFL